VLAFLLDTSFKQPLAFTSSTFARGAVRLSAGGIPCRRPFWHLGFFRPCAATRCCDPRQGFGTIARQSRTTFVPCARPLHPVRGRYSARQRSAESRNTVAIVTDGSPATLTTTGRTASKTATWRYEAGATSSMELLWMKRLGTGSSGAVDYAAAQPDLIRALPRFTVR
jgi:hypothetical protein